MVRRGKKPLGRHGLRETLTLVFAATMFGGTDKDAGVPAIRGVAEAHRSEDSRWPNETKLSGECQRVHWSARLGCDDLVQAFEDGHQFFGGKVGDSLA